MPQCMLWHRLTTQVPGVVELADLGAEARAFLALDRQVHLEELSAERLAKKRGFRGELQRFVPGRGERPFAPLRVAIASHRRSGIELLAHAVFGGRQYRGHRE